MSSRDDWVPLAAGVVVGAGLLALLYKMLSGRAAYSTKSHNFGASTYTCTCKKGEPAMCRIHGKNDVVLPILQQSKLREMCDCAEELERKCSRTRPIPSLQSEASSLCGWSGVLSSLPAPGGWAKSWVPIIGTTTLALYALYYKFKDKLKALLWSASDPCDGFVPKIKPAPPEKLKICDCNN